MKTLTFILGLGTAVALSTAFAAEMKQSDKATAKETTFIKKAADGGMTEVELGKVAEKNGQRQDVKTFGEQMVTDHGKANDELKNVASNLGVNVPDQVSAKHQSTIDAMSKKNGDAFDATYINAMVSDHEKDIAEFEKARNEVTNPDLKKFIDDALPVMKHHLEMAKTMKQTK
jgi:putative membrane protein